MYNTNKNLKLNKLKSYNQTYDEEALINQNLIPDFKPNCVKHWDKHKDELVWLFLIVCLLLMIVIIILTCFFSTINSYEIP